MNVYTIFYQWPWVCQSFCRHVCDQNTNKEIDEIFKNTKSIYRPMLNIYEIVSLKSKLSLSCLSRRLKRKIKCMVLQFNSNLYLWPCVEQRCEFPNLEVNLFGAHFVDSSWASIFQLLLGVESGVLGNMWHGQAQRMFCWAKALSRNDRANTASKISMRTSVHPAASWIALHIEDFLSNLKSQKFYHYNDRKGFYITQQSLSGTIIPANQKNFLEQMFLYCLWQEVLENELVSKLMSVKCHSRISRNHCIILGQDII